MQQLLPFMGGNMPYIGEIINGDCQIVEQIGKGGTGEIYKAYHLNLHKYVVVKKIMDGFVGSIEARAEVDILKQLHHTGLPQVYNFLMIGNNVYTVMEYIEGYDFKYYIDNGYAFSEQSLWTWLEQLADVLNYLHSHGILHMDIKPGNIMLTNEGNICLIDFNISMCGNNTNDLVGMSYAYASPEQVMKWNGITQNTMEANIILDARSDIYSLGVSFYHMMTRVEPNPMQQGLILLSAYSQYYSKNLITIVSKMMEIDREKRYQSAAKLKQAIAYTQRSKAEKATLKGVFVLMLSAISVLVIVLGVVVYRNVTGMTGRDAKKIATEETILKNYYDQGDFTEAIDEAERFLLAESGTLNRVEKSRVGILTVLADSYRESGRYYDAIDCYLELLTTDERFSVYQGLAISYAHVGEYQNAETYLKKAEEIGGREEELLEIRAEIAVASGKVQDALQTYQRINEISQSVHSVRRMGSLFLQAANGTEIASEQQKYYRGAVGCYERLMKENCASYNDKINLATAYEGLEEGEKLMNVLQGLIVEYPGRYEAYFRVAVWKYKEQMKLVPASRNLTEALNAASQAEALYRDAGARDEQFESFLRILEDIR